MDNFFNLCFSLKRKQFENLAKSICKIFSEEEIDLYYEPSYVMNEKSSTNSNKRQNPKGLLYREYENYRSKMRKVGLLTKRIVTHSSIPVNSLAGEGWFLLLFLFLSFF